MDMNYLPLGKMGCGNCEDVDYYCDECTRKILEVVNAAQQRPESCTCGANLDANELHSYNCKKISGADAKKSKG